MIQLFSLVLELCAKLLGMLCDIGTSCVHLKELDPVYLYDNPQKEFGLGNPQILLLFTSVLKFLPLFTSSISIASKVHLQGWLRLI